jgi:hypothetical protein
LRDLCFRSLVAWTTNDDQEPIIFELDRCGTVTDGQDTKSAEGDVEDGDVLVDIDDVEFGSGGHGDGDDRRCTSSKMGMGGECTCLRAVWGSFMLCVDV